MDSRTSTILDAAIREFIETGEPVSSGRLYENYSFGIKPAMIRLVLDGLEEEGFLEQPHHSAGRVPTDAGYEFFARRFLEGNQRETHETELNHLCERHAWQDFMHELSGELGLLSVVAELGSDLVYKSGLEALMERLEWENKEELRSVIRDFEAMDERVLNAADTVGDGPKVFIGRQSPVTRSENLSVVGGNYRVGNSVVSIFAIGPKRMDYKKVIRIFRNL